MVAKGVKVDSRAAVDTFEAANAEAAQIFADRSAYENYLPLFGNISTTAASRTGTEAVSPPRGPT